MSSSNETLRTSRRLKAICLTLATITVLAAGVLPACVNGLCCPVTPDAPAVHSQMPCCTGQTSIAPGEITRVRPATYAGFNLQPQTWAAAAVVAGAGASELSPARVPATLATGLFALREPSPPLFLLNAQFLI